MVECVMNMGSCGFREKRVCFMWKFLEIVDFIIN